jgi:phosphatidylserine/phosphatidylglycerophosphate/cardiolipin synthase-like enzyme
LHDGVIEMRFQSNVTGGFQVFAVTGVNTVSFAVKATKAARAGLLGFAVDRAHKGRTRRMRGFKVFQSVIPKPTAKTEVSTHDHPIQSLVWDDFTAQPGEKYEYVFHPLRGEPLKLDRKAAPVSVHVRTEMLFGKGKETHDVFFNRGVASSQAYVRKFGNHKPDDLDKKTRARALQWLSRDLDEAIVAFIRSARKGDALRGCFYEFRYKPVLDELKKAIDRGVDVLCIVDLKDNGTAKQASFPRTENEQAIKAAKISKKHIVRREARKSEIQHNKFLVLLKGAKRTPKEVWTGSTNLSVGGIHGQTNVGHWIRNASVARDFLAYWKLLSTDPGGRIGDSRSEASKKNAEFLTKVDALATVPTSIAKIAKGVTAIFSPRSKLSALDLYVKLLDDARKSSHITLAFGVGTAFKDALKDNTSKDHITFLLLEKEDKPNKKSKTPFVALKASNNVYQAWGSYLRDAVYQWAKETNNRSLKFNEHVAYIHSKFLLADPLSADPIVVTGSANFSEASTVDNDENMVIIRGDQRAADIYFTEYNRLFNHYYFRAVHEKTKGKDPSTGKSFSLFLAEDDSWLAKYEPGTVRQKRVNLFTSMAGAKNG